MRMSAYSGWDVQETAVGLRLERAGVVLWRGDCLNILPTIEDESVDMIWTDPPFGHGNMQDDLQAARVRDGVKGARVRQAEPIANDIGPEFDDVMLGFLDHAGRVLRRDCCCCCCCMAGGGPNVTFARVAKWVDEKLAFFQAIVWDKSARGNGMGWRYRRNYEFVMVAHRKGGRLLWADDDVQVPNIVRHMPVRERKHPNEKPLAMVEDFLQWHTEPDQVVLDPFAGSFTTAEACVRLQRRCIAIEQDPQHFATGVQRITAAILAEKSSLFPATKPPQQVELF
jgi:DNA modification methylase